MTPTATSVSGRIAPVSLDTLPPYSPTTYVDFTQPAHRASFEQALAEVKAQFGRTYPLVIGGERVDGAGTFETTNPARPAEVVGRFQSGSAVQAARAIDAADQAFATWSRVPAAERAAYLVAAATRMRERRHLFSAWMVFEVGKSWGEADADTAEAIDFLEFYAREMLRYDQPPPLTQLPGETDSQVYVPLGVGAIIPPWNFPLAICVGMASAAIVAGNTIVVKPASDSPAIAWQFHALMEEVGLPPGVFNFVTGGGGTVGDALVRHARTRFVSFTGSKAVGIGINKLAAEVQPGQRWLKRVVAEMGGKDAIIVDDEADVDAAVEGVAVSAFGFQGQKCSACSRAIVHEKLYDEFLERLKARTEKTTIGPTEERENFLGPVVSASAEKKILEYIAIGKGEGRLITGGEKHSGPGFFLKPTIFADVKPTARIAQEEIFGPVLAVIKARSFDEEVEIANGTIYGLTGSYYGRDRARIVHSKQRLHVGNLYINRKCTGALVGIHPFGGFNMSGTDSKAGGRDYLGLFLQAKSIAEYVG